MRLRQHLSYNSYYQQRVKYAHELRQHFGDHGMLNHYDISNLVYFKYNICKSAYAKAFISASLREHSIDPFKIKNVITCFCSLNDHPFRDRRGCFN